MSLDLITTSKRTLFIGIIDRCFMVSSGVRWILKLLLIFALWNNVHAQGPLAVYHGNAQFLCPKDSNDWFPLGGYCHTLMYNLSTHKEAAHFCASKNGILLSVNDSMETWDMSWRLYSLLQTAGDQKNLVWTAYEIGSLNPPPIGDQQFSTSPSKPSCQVLLNPLRQRHMPLFTNLWAVGEPRLDDPTRRCVALDVNIYEPDQFGWHTIDCQTTQLPFVCSYLACQQNEFRCHDNSRCINQTWACDGVEDCPDSSDETGCTVECGADYLTNLTGTLTSPNFPRNYPDDATCVWQILVPKQFKINLKFENFETERFHDILYAKEGFWEEKQDWDSLPETYVFNKSGPISHERFTYKTATNSLLLKFTSDDSITKNGFIITWEADDTVKNCVPDQPLLAGGKEKELSSPGYYPSRIMCEWVVQSREIDTVVSLQFNEFSLAKNDWVEIYDRISSTDEDKSTIDDELIAQYSMEHPPYTITSRYESLKIVFYSDPNRAAHGFSSVYKSGCADLTINSTYAYFRSADVDGHLALGNCGWRLSHPLGKKITLVIENVELYGNDSIKVHSDSGEMTFKNGTIVFPISSNSGLITVQFLSTSNYSGFEASFSEDCPSLASVPHANASSTETYYGVTVYFVCEPGYKVHEHDSSNTTCGPNGNWTQKLPKCDTITCTAPPRMDNGVIQAMHCTDRSSANGGEALSSAPSRSATAEGCTAIYACTPGCTRNASQMRCSLDGQWTPVTNTCQPATCTDPPAPPPYAVFNSESINRTTYFLNDRVRYECVLPYWPIGPAYAVCTVTGDWLMSNFTCKKFVCHSPQVPFGNAPEKKYQFGHVLADFRCLPGFRPNRTSIQCGNGTWDSELVCEDVDECELSNGTVACHGGTCRNVKGGWLCNCERGWAWNNRTNKCEDVDECTSYEHECDSDDSCVNTAGSYECRCLQGFELYTPPRAAVFRKNQTRPAVATNLVENRSCVPIRCPKPIYNSSMIRMFTNDSLYQFRTELRYECKRPYASRTGAPLSTVIARCSADGRWTNGAPECVEASCQPPIQIANGHFAPRLVNGTTIPPGSVIEYFCDDSYVLIGTKRRVCSEASLTWSGGEPICEKIRCPELDPPEGGFVTFDKERTAGSGAHFYCDPFHELIGVASLTCDADGCWRGKSPRCRALACPLDGLPPLVAPPEGKNISSVPLGQSIQFRCLLPGFAISDRRPLICSTDDADLPFFPAPPSASAIADHRRRRPQRSSTRTFPEIEAPCSRLSIRKITSDTYVDEGEPVALTCAIDADCDGFQITWERGSTIGRSDRTRHLSPLSTPDVEPPDHVTFIQTGSRTYTMQIRATQRSDSGFYWCKVWYRNEVRTSRRVMLVVSTDRGGGGRPRRESLAADRLPADIVYLYDSKTDNETEWSVLNGSNETQRFSFANASSFGLCRVPSANNSWLRSPSFPSFASNNNDSSSSSSIASVRIEMISYWPFCPGPSTSAFEPCIRLGIAEHSIIGRGEPEERSYRILDHTIQPFDDAEDADRSQRRWKRPVRLEASIKIGGRSETSGYRLAVINYGQSCAEIRRVVVRRVYCPEFQRGLAYYPRTIAPVRGSLLSKTIVSGRCVQGAEEIIPATNVECRADGRWASDPSGGTCVCRRGYARINGACVRRGPLCYACRDATSIDQCNRRSSLQQCRWDEVCSTTITRTPSTNTATVSLTKGCSRSDQCRNRIRNLAACIRGEDSCRLCCADDYCNIVPFRTPQPIWNASFPRCTDVEPPRFVPECPRERNVTILLDFDGNPISTSDGDSDRAAAPIEMPRITDNDGNGGVSIRIQPEDLWSKETYASGRPVKVTMVAKDRANLTSTCSFYVVPKAYRHPRLNCTRTSVEDTIAYLEHSQRTASARYPQFEFTDGRATLRRVYDPPQGTLIEIGRAVRARVTAWDEQGSMASCEFSYTIRATGCPQWTLPGYDPRLTPTLKCHSDSDGTTRCSVPLENCTIDGHHGWIPAEGPFAFACNGSGIWRVVDGMSDGHGEDPTVDHLPVCSPRIALNRTADNCPDGYGKQATNGSLGEIEYFCVQCPPGTFVDVSKSPSCTPCPVGAYQPSWTSDSCLACPNGTSTTRMYSRSVDECIAFCPPGRFSATGLEPCDACPLGYYQPHRRNFNCVRCPGDRSTVNFGAVELDECKDICKPGSFGDGGLAPCFACPRGYFQPDERSEMCRKCDDGSTTMGEGATDSAECRDPEPCSPDFCSNGGRCTSAWPQNRCQCAAGTFGRRCTSRLRACSNSTCTNGGRCVVEEDGDGEIRCECPEGTSGIFCERVLPHSESPDPAAPSFDQDDSHRPSCAPIQCSACSCDPSNPSPSPRCHWNVTDDPCGCNPCAMCSPTSTLSCSLNFSAPDSFVCSCRQGFGGRFCEKTLDGDDCSSGRCQNRRSCPVDGCSEGIVGDDDCPCQNGGECVVEANGDNETLRCQCARGYGGGLCQKIIDPCLEHPCMNQGDCRWMNASDPQAFECQCPNGWTGAICDEEIDHCESNPCSNGGQCNGYHGGFHCTCSNDWTGAKCETRLDSCLAFQCYNGGTCNLDAQIDKTSRLIASCTCSPPWTGPHCETNACADPITCQSNETCVQSTSSSRCADRPTASCSPRYCDNGGTCRLNETYGYTCECAAGFAGDTCSTESNVCEHNMCQNNATCARSAKGSYLCFCQMGYYGQYCESTISGCDQNPCHNGGTCTDVGNGIFCICTSLYTGQFCDKAKSQNFNMLFAGRETMRNMSWIVTSEFTLTDKMNSITLCFWVRFNEQQPDDAPRQMTYLTVAKVRRNKERPTELNLLPFVQFTETGLILNSPGIKDRKLEIGLPVNDSSWHSVCFEWHWSTSDWTLYIDGPKFKCSDDYDRKNFDATTITQGPYTMVLGQSTDKQRFFYGELSMVSLYSAFELTSSTPIPNDHAKCDGALNGEESSSSKATTVVRWIDFTQPDPGDVSVVLTYPSVCSSSYCLPEQKDCGAVDKIPPDVKFCPKDKAVYSATRLKVATWPEPRFADNVEVVSVVSNFRSGQLLPWGEYQIVYTAQDKAGNSAVCKFRLYVTPFKCENLTNPTNTTQIDCQRFSQGLVCTLNCTDDQYFTQIVRPFYVCGIEGAYDFLRPDVPVIVPACSPKADVSSTSMATVHARLLASGIVDCTSNVNAIRTRLVERLESVVGNRSAGFGALCLANRTTCNYSRALSVQCASSNGGRSKRAADVVEDSDASNETADDSTVVESTNSSRLDLTFTWRTSNQSLLDSLIARILKDDADGSKSITILEPPSTTITCPVGSTFTDGICVLCSIGTYYESSTELCAPCPLNTYNNRVGQSTCTPCDDGEITVGPGGQLPKDCITNCTPGTSFDYDTRTCVTCAIGLYQKEHGATSCSSCPPAQTTRGTGSTNPNDCIYLCGPGTELDASGVSCAQCPKGTYKSALNDTGCSNCPMDYTTAASGSISADNCTVLYCSPGKYRSEDAQSCLPCQIGTYQSQYDQRTCLVCPNSQDTKYPQSTSAKDCRAGGCSNMCDLCPTPKNATCTYHACVTKCECNPNYQRIDNTSYTCIDKCELQCAGRTCVRSEQGDPICQSSVHTDVKTISITVGAASGGFVAIVLVITLIVIFKVRLYHLIRCCKKPTVKEMHSNQYYRSSTYPAISDLVRSNNPRRRVSSTSEMMNGTISTTVDDRSGNGAVSGRHRSVSQAGGVSGGLGSIGGISYNPAVECFTLRDLGRPDVTNVNQMMRSTKNEFDMMTPGEVYSAIYEGLQGVRGDRALSDYLTSASQSTAAMFENRAFDFDDEPPAPPSPPPYGDENDYGSGTGGGNSMVIMTTPEAVARRFRPQPPDPVSDDEEGDYFS